MSGSLSLNQTIQALQLLQMYGGGFGTSQLGAYSLLGGGNSSIGSLLSGLSLQGSSGSSSPSSSLSSKLGSTPYFGYMTEASYKAELKRCDQQAKMFPIYAEGRRKRVEEAWRKQQESGGAGAAGGAGGASGLGQNYQAMVLLQNAMNMMNNMLVALRALVQQQQQS